jgi:hypothetical protein
MLHIFEALLPYLTPGPHVASVSPTSHILAPAIKGYRKLKLIGVEWSRAINIIPDLVKIGQIALI